MKRKLFPNIQKMTNLFCVGIVCVTVSVLGLRLTVFSDMAPKTQSAYSHILTNEQNGYRINGEIYFSASDSKGDVLATNLEGNEFNIKVDIALADSGKSILTTGFIKPGQSADSWKMNPTGQKLKEGVYQCVAEITAHNPEDLKPVGSETEMIEIYIGVKPEMNSGK